MRVLLLGAALLAALAPRPLAAASACPPGRFVVTAGVLVREPGPVREVVVLGERTVAVEGTCAETGARLRGRRDGTRVRARWGGSCAGLPVKVVLKAMVREACERLEGRLVVRRGEPSRRPFVAVRSRCGDGLRDGGLGEECDGGDAAACPGACRTGCTCASPTGSTTTTLPAATRTGVYAVTETGLLLHFGGASPATPVASTAIAGLGPGEVIGGVDFRPATGELYALGVTAGATDAVTLYRLDADAAVAVPVGAPVAGLVHGLEYGVAFNPVTDRLRVVNDGDESLRIDPDTGARTDVPDDTNLNPAGRLIRGLAHTPGGAATTLFGLCFFTDELIRIGGPNGVPSANFGAISGLGSFGVAVGAGSSGFDVDPQTGAALATLRATLTGLTGLYAVDLQTGAATLVGPVGDGTVRVPSLAIAPGGATLAP